MLVHRERPRSALWSPLPHFSILSRQVCQNHTKRNSSGLLSLFVLGPCGYLMNVMAQNNINASNKVLREISYDEILLSKYYNRIVCDIVTHVLLCYYIR